MIKKKTPEDATKGIVEHEGFMIDLLDLIKSRLNFNYTVYEVEDRGYGVEVSPGKWNGMVGDLMKRENEVSVISFIIIRIFHVLNFIKQSHIFLCLRSRRFILG